MTGIANLLAERFGETPSLPESIPAFWQQLAGRGVCRRFKAEKVDAATLDALLALALCAPSKSDLQQRDIVVVDDPELRAQLNTMLTTGRLAQPWIADAPHLLVFCANNRRQRLWHEWRGRPFVNDHLDAFFNAAVDAGIAMTAFILAAEAAGLGCCPISAIRNDSATVSRLLGLPQFVFPVVALAVGWPSGPVKRSMRLPLSVTVHRNRYDDSGVRAAIDGYDRRRAAAQPYAQQRVPGTFGTTTPYGWSEDKARQYAEPEREGFGAFIRSRGFKLD